MLKSNNRGAIMIRISRYLFIAAIALLAVSMVFDACKNSPATSSEGTVQMIGVAVDEQGYIVPNARVEAFDQNGIMIASAISDDVGAFSLPNIPEHPNAVKLRLSHTDFRQLEVDLASMIGGRSLSEPVVLQPLHLDSACAHIAILVTDINSHTALSGAEVRLFRGNTHVTTAMTDLQGRVSFNYVIAGNYTLRVSLNGYQILHRSVSVQFCDSLSLDMRMTPGGTTNPADTCCHAKLTVYARDSITNAALDGVGVLVFGSNSSCVSRSQITAQGQPAVFTNMCPGTYTVRLEKQGYALQYFTVVLGCNQVLQVTRLMSLLNTNPADTCCHGVLSVYARDSVTNALLDGTSIVLMTANSTCPGRTVITQQGQPAVFQNMCPGTYTIRLQKSGYLLKYITVTMGCNQVLQATGLLKPAQTHPVDTCCNGRLTVIPRDSITNALLSGVSVLFTGSSPGTIVTQPGALAVFNNVCPGNYYVRLEKAGYVIRYIHLTMGCNQILDLTALMRPNPSHPDTCCHGSITVVALDSATNSPVAGAVASLYQSTNPSTGALTVTTNAQGVAVFGNRCPGAYYIHISRNNRPYVGLTVTLGCNEQKTVTGQLP
jgi:hypothetical protein